MMASPAPLTTPTPTPPANNNTIGGNGIVAQATNRINSMSLTQKVLFGTILMAMLFSLGFLVNKATDQYDVLYSNLSIPDAAATVSKLKELNKPYKLSDGGTTILVPHEVKNELVLETASELTSSEPVSLAKIPPVLQGDVQKEWLKKFNTDSIGATLTSIQGIRNAKVMIAQPEESVFSENEDPIQASVMLIVDPGFRLKEKQISTIKNLVAHSVPKLAPENVVISDNQGNTLDDSPQGGGGGVGQTRESKQQKLEGDVRKKVLSLLEPIVGKDNAVVSVSADLNFDQSRAKTHSVTPVIKDEKTASGLVVSQQLQSEEYSGTKKAEGGKIGAETNTAPSYQAEKKEEGGGDGKQYKSKKETTNFAHSEEDKEVIYASGTLQRLTIAVVLNKILTTDETKELKESITNAAGLNPERGDSVDVKGFQFSEPPSQKQQALLSSLKESQQQELILQVGYGLLLLLLGGGALLVLLRIFSKPLPQAQAELLIDTNRYSSNNSQPQQEGTVISLPSVMFDSNGNEIDHDTLEADEHGYLLPPNNEPVFDQQGRLIQIGSIRKEDLKLPDIGGDTTPEVEYMRQSIIRIVEADPETSAKMLVTYLLDDESRNQ
ncbi:MAG: flagellar basal-body MS-ring/collar protein FliF [Candidatus Melainabacteria bacterium]|jgi:flagellar M-ring protein FliF|nr:flagellar basal-body MS-ring/collar protein FliF [Candidatus Melainabacteria bacterium]